MEDIFKNFISHKISGFTNKSIQGSLKVNQTYRIAEIMNKAMMTILKHKFTDIFSTFFSTIPAITAEA
jgi:hypothetical protein